MRILVVEDEPDICKALADALRQEHYAVDTADDGASALAKVHVEQAYDLLLLDLMLPEIDGLQVLRQLRSRSMGCRSCASCGPKETGHLF